MPACETAVRRDSRRFAELCEELFRRGYSVQFRVHGESMRPNQLDGDVVTVCAAPHSELGRGDVAFTETAERLPCAPVILKADGPIASASSHFLLATVVLIGGATGIGIWKVYESPDRP